MKAKGKETKKGETMSKSKYIRFDWAAKNILRNKEDFVVLESFMRSWAEGYAEGYAEGWAEGLKQGKAEAAKAMKLAGLDIEQIIRFTGLSREEIIKL